MYVNYNDYELIYLVKEGITPARKVLFDKYSILLKKMFKEGYYYKIYSIYIERSILHNIVLYKEKNLDTSNCIKINNLICV